MTPHWTERPPDLKIRAMTGSPEERIRTAGGISLVSRGNGDQVLLLHGIGGSSATFAALTALLDQAGFQTHAWDAPGYGDSVDPSHQGVDHAGVAMAVLKEVCGGPAHLVGTSWGGTIAIQMALRQPDWVRSVVALDSTRGSGVTPSRRQSMLERLADLEMKGSTTFAEERASRVVADTCPPAVCDAVHRTMAQVREAGYGAAAHMMAATDLGPWLHEVVVPTLVLVGELDRVTGVEESELIAAAIPGAEFGLIRGAGHSAVAEKPEECAAHMRRFWARAG